MGIKFDIETQTWSAFFSKRHPITRMPKTLRRIGFKSEAEARREEKKLVVEVEQALLETVTPSWQKVVTEYMDSKRLTDWNNKSYQNCKLCLEAHTFPSWKARKIDSILPQEIKSLVAERVGKTSSGNQETLLKFIRGTFQFAVDSGYLARNPTPKIKLKIGEKIKKVLTEDQVRLLLNKAREYKNPWYYHWAMALYTGMRNGELYALTWDKVNFERRQILVDSAWNKVDGFKCTKSGNDRIVEIAPTLLVVLKELKLKQINPVYVLPRSRNWEKGEQARMLRMFLQGIGLPEVRFHDLRATWATIMLNRGIEPIKVMSMGGWSNLKTMQIYIRKAGVNIQGISNVLDLHDTATHEAEVLAFPKV